MTFSEFKGQSSSNSLKKTKQTKLNVAYCTGFLCTKAESTLSATVGRDTIHKYPPWAVPAG